MSVKVVARLAMAAFLAGQALSPAAAATQDAPAGGNSAVYAPPVNAPGDIPASSQADKPFGVESGTSNIKYFDFDFSSQTPGNAAARSAFVPGWGQAFNDQKVKGTVMFITAAAAVGGSLALFRSANKTYDDYKATGVANDNAYDEYKRRWTQSAILGGAAAGIWIYSIIDAYRNGYSSLYSTRSEWNMVALADGGAVVWRREFK
jgi:hypothetical protein